MPKSSAHRRLVQLIRQIAREEAYTVMDEHLDDYIHKEKPANDAFMEKH